MNDYFSNQRGRKKKFPDMKPFSFRFPESVIQAIDDIADTQSRQTKYTITRTDILLKLMLDFIEIEDGKLS